MAKKANQTITGKAFEYALLNEFYKRLSPLTEISVVENACYETAKECFDFFSDKV